MWIGRENDMHHLASFRFHLERLSKVSSVKKYGVIQGVRGEPWCVLSDGNKPPGGKFKYVQVQIEHWQFM